jgi:hypothetical protein
MTDPNGPELIRASAAAKRLHIHPVTLKRWSARGDFPPPVCLGPRGDRFYKVVDIEHHLDTHMSGAATC